MSEWDFAFGLTGQALEDALSTGATYEEWAMIEQELEREVIGNHGKNVFAFIDAEYPKQVLGGDRVAYFLSCG